MFHDLVLGLGGFLVPLTVILFIRWLMNKSGQKLKSLYSDNSPFHSEQPDTNNLPKHSCLPELVNLNYSHHYELEYVDEGEKKLLIPDGFENIEDHLVDGYWLLDVSLYDKASETSSFIRLNSKQVVLVKDMSAGLAYLGSHEVCAFFQRQFEMQEYDRRCSEEEDY